MRHVRKEDRKTSLENKTLHINSLPIIIRTYLNDLKEAEYIEDRQKAVNDILKALSSGFGLPTCTIHLYNKKRPLIPGRKKGDRKVSFWYRGVYRVNPKKRSLIEIWNMSPCEIVVEGHHYEGERTLSWMNILGILLHEFIHHYDYKHLHIDIDHDLGFWSRLRHLRKMVLTHIDLGS